MENDATMTPADGDVVADGEGNPEMDGAPVEGGDADAAEEEAEA